MKKTLTAAIAIAAIAGLSMAAVETAPAGYEEKDANGTQILVCNPFLSFTSPTTTLGDIDGSSVGNGAYIAVVSSGGQLTKYYWYDGVWYTEANGAGTPSNGVTLSRGDAIQFSGTAAHPLLLSGIIADDAAGVAKTATVGYTVVGNAAPVAKSLSAFSITGNYDYNKDYVSYKGTKYIYKSGHWYERGTTTIADSVSVAAGDGLFLFCQKRTRGTDKTYPTITVPAQ